MAESMIPTVVPAGKKKAKKKVEKPNAVCLAFREYERVSYYLATKGDFNFDMDDAAREEWNYNEGDAAKVQAMTKQRLKAWGREIPKGDHIDGLGIRTLKRYPAPKGKS